MQKAETLPVISREIQDILTIKTSERHRWLADGRLACAGTRTVRLNGRARRITFHVFDPKVVEDLLDRGAFDERRVDLIQFWLTQFDRGGLNDDEAEASVNAEYEAHITALERKVGQLTMELDLMKKNSAPADRRRQRELLHHHRPPTRSIRRGCKMVDLPRSSYYYRSAARALNPADAQLVTIIEAIQDGLPCYGYRRITHELQRRGHLVNHRRVAGVM